MRNTILVGVVLTFAGCTGLGPLKGGKATTARAPSGGVQQTLVQGENPAQVTSQGQETVKVRSYTVPAGSRIQEAQVEIGPGGLLMTNLQTTIVSEPMPVVEREELRAKTELGAAQKDTARELTAKLASLKGVVWIGVGLFLLGLASLVYPPLKLVIGSVTTSAAMVVGGLALMVLPSLIVGNELLVLGGVAVAVGGWFLAHRHGRLRGAVDANKNGVDDRLEAVGKAGRR